MSSDGCRTVQVACTIIEDRIGNISAQILSKGRKSSVCLCGQGRGERKGKEGRELRDNE